MFFFRRVGRDIICSCPGCLGHNHLLLVISSLSLLWVADFVLTVRMDSCFVSFQYDCQELSHWSQDSLAKRNTGMNEVSCSKDRMIAVITTAIIHM